MSTQDPGTDIDPGRRALLTGAAVAAAALGSGALVHLVQAAPVPRGEPASSKSRWGLLVDTSRCADGCRDCVEACARENGLDLQVPPHHEAPQKWDGQRAVWIRKVKIEDDLTGRVTTLPLMCQHCEHPPCVDVCPTGASFKRADGIVMVDRHTCIGCRYCMMACPYKARSFIHEVVHDQLTRVPRGKGCVESCNLCVSRRDYGLDSTACAEACTAAGHHAILFGDLNDPTSAISQALAAAPSRQIREDLDLNTGVRYAGV
jgi:tetrathionate reductase subunit B